MRRRDLAALVGLLLLFALAGAADRSSAAALEPSYQAAYDEAVAWWGQGSPPRCEVVQLEEVTAELLQPTPRGLPGVWGEATQPTTDGEECRLAILEGLEPCQYRWTMRHEVGHLLGYGHSTDLSSPMYPISTADCVPPPPRRSYTLSASRGQRHQRVRRTRVNGAHAAQKRSQK